VIEGVDYSASRPSPSGLVNVGKLFVGRYVGAGYGEKLLQAPEAQQLSDAGLRIVSLVEGAAGGALSGRNMGILHAEQARQWHTDRGFPWPVPCYFAVDFDVQAVQWDAVLDYFQGAASVIGLPFVGIYGGLNAMLWAKTADVARWFMQTYAWSGGIWANGVHIEQYRNEVSLVGGTVDLCRAPTDSYGGWTMDPTPTTGPPATDAQKLNDLVWSVGRGAPMQPPAVGNEAITYWAGHVTDRLAAIQASLDALAAKEAAEPSGVDLGPVTVAIEALGAKVDAIATSPTVDAVAVAIALAANPSLVAQLGAAVAAQLAVIDGEITLSGTLAGRVKPAAG
jgi:Domain of unknown function (DUF1906)